MATCFLGFTPLNSVTPKSKIPLFIRSSKPYISGNAFRSICQHCFDDYASLSPEAVKEQQFVFVATHKLGEFFFKVHPKISNRYVLITHNSDDSAPGRYINFLNDQKIIAWFTQNCDANHPKVFCLPIGIANPRWKHGDTQKIEAMKRFSYRKKNLIYANFSKQTNPKERSHCLQKLKRIKNAVFSKPKDFNQYLKDLSQSKFIASPEGNGIDCHRTWESLLMGAIPIVTESHITEMFKDLRVLVIKDWRKLPTSNQLEKIYIKLLRKKVNRNKLFFPYWENYIHSTVQKILKNSEA